MKKTGAVGSFLKTLIRLFCLHVTSSRHCLRGRKNWISRGRSWSKWSMRKTLSRKRMRRLSRRKWNCVSKPSASTKNASFWDSVLSLNLIHLRFQDRQQSFRSSSTSLRRPRISVGRRLKTPRLSMRRHNESWLSKSRRTRTISTWSETWEKSNSDWTNSWKTLTSKSSSSQTTPSSASWRPCARNTRRESGTTRSKSWRSSRRSTCTRRKVATFILR